jgi:hypothetical protein
MNFGSTASAFWQSLSSVGVRRKLVRIRVDQPLGQTYGFHQFKYLFSISRFVAFGMIL